MSLIFKLKLKKTYWSIAVPAGLLIIGELAKKLDIIVKVTKELYDKSEEGWIKQFWNVIHLYFSINLPAWGLILGIIILVLVTYVYLEELKAKKLGIVISEKSITDNIFNRLSNNIKNIDDKIEEIKSELTFQPDKDWFYEQCNSSICDLGNRYTPKLNVKLELSEIFEGLGRTEEFKKKVTKRFDQFLIKGKKVLENQPEVKESLESIENSFEELQTLFHKIDFLGTDSIPINEFDNLLNEVYNSVQQIYNYYITEELKIQKEKNDYQYYHKYGFKLRRIREFEYEFSSFQSLIQGTSFKLANNPFLLLDGEAGIGKSHLIGDIVSRRINKEYESVFLLGQHFVTEEDPWTQIFKRLQINSKSEDFLRKLNQRAEESGKRIILFIDAINEGKGNYFWNEFVKSFINEIKKYQWLGLVLTIRISYKNLIFPKEEISNIDIVQYHHDGFRNIEYQASKLFFDNYRIELPNVPLLHPEFQNPLFLKLFCEGINKAGLTRIPDGLQGITSIINFFVKNVNIVLSKPKRVGYSDSLNLVQKSIYALIKYKVDNQFRYVPYELAHEVINKSISNFIDKKGFIDELITEGVLSRNRFWKEGDDYEEGVYLAYERFEDHLTVQYLLEQSTELEKEFKEDGKLYNYVEDENAIYKHKGLIEAFSIQVPEMKGYEFHNLIPDLKDKQPIVDTFVESLLWRKVETINEESLNYVNNHVLIYQDTNDYFWETILSVTGIPNHFFNAHFLHNHLIQFSLADRDADWTQLLRYKYDDKSSVKRLIDWAWSETNKSHISDESILLSSITLAWFHTSTNRKLRDCSTKSLVCLLHNRLNVLLELLKMFEEVNDPYVTERLFAVAYGCVLRTNQKEKIANLSEYVFKVVFSDPTGVIPHILLRDYARGVIEYTHHLGIELSFELSNVRPPYKSNWPEKILSYEDLEEKYDNDQYWDLWNSVMGFGDFARYTIGTNSNTSSWSGCKKGETPIDRKEVFIDFKNKLNPEQLELLNGLDPIITEEPDDNFKFGHGINVRVAIGRKTEQELDQIRDDFKKLLSRELLSEYNKEVEPFLDHNNNIINTGRYFDLRVAQRLIFSKVIELGWSPKLHLSFDKENFSSDRRASSNERIGKKYQWIAYYEYMALLSDNFIKLERWGEKKEKPYKGPWDPYVRDIDPTLLVSKTGSYDDQGSQDFWWKNNKIFNWDCTNESWIKESSMLPNMTEIIQVKDGKEVEWLVLEGYPSWSEPKKIGNEKWDQPHKEFWCHIRSYLVVNDEFTSFKDWAINQHFLEYRMPKSGNKYEMFSREYYWSPAQDYLLTEYSEKSQWTGIYDKVSREYVAEVNVTAQGFLWEEEFDKSKEETISFLKPSFFIHKGMNLKESHREGEFIDDSNVIQCFAANVYHNSESYLLVRKNSFLTFLSKNNLKIVWTVSGEKEISGGMYLGTNYPGRLEISGVYYFEEEKLKGFINTKNNR
ncbi:AVAST type 2 anti-phage system protein Avs2 [uncultured Tenacibaculum sp.]|uniref:AVAST type 2 anti-phage system protein Avs2 n=1 Tax=uncultured Tenacibaculum sp. TaxID=174713 RepID=UPI0026271FA5|nr:AVAST type 2 anti-phage system protein Avs2 [uncultured Tenacibaculum sp.]